MVAEPPQVTSISEWKKDSEVQPHPLELPSGKVCLARAVGVEAFLASGMIPNSLIGILQKQIDRGRLGVVPDKPDTLAKLNDDETEEMLSELLKEPGQLAEVLAMADALTVYCVIEPVITAVPTSQPDGTSPPRDEALLYVDEVDMDDKFFIMAFALGGTRDLESFREATSSGVASVPARKTTKRPAQRAGGAKRKK